MNKFILVMATLLFFSCKSVDSPQNDPEDANASLSATSKTNAQTIEKHNGLDTKVPIQEQSRLDTKALIDVHIPKFAESLGYKPSDAKNLKLIQGSRLALNEAELVQLEARGFVISARQSFESFTLGYERIYAADLPVYVSADSLMFALHRSYDRLLADIEQSALIPELDAMISEMRTALKLGALKDLPKEVIQDIDLYLAVTLGLLRGGSALSVAGADNDLIKKFYEKADAAVGSEKVEIFGSERDMDFSQHKPRGHYTDTEMLSRYFKAMMWLGRTDLRMIETKPDGSQVVLTRQLLGAVGLHALMAAKGKTFERWQRIDATIGALVGISDNMTPAEVPSLLKDLKVKSLVEVEKIPADRLAQILVEGGYGQQHIASQIMHNQTQDGSALPLAVSFALMGQRFTPDSFVFSNVVYDRIKARRMMPNPLDVAFAALGNGHAVALLKPELEQYAYAANLEAARLSVNAHDPEILNGSLYMLWIGALRALSADGPDSVLSQKGLPTVAQTEAWSRRILNTQLASWAELRHDTILYAKQSHTGVPECEFPDAYVDPYPAFFAAIERYATFGAEKFGALPYKDPAIQTQIQAYFKNLKESADILKEMAEFQRAGTPHTKAHLAFINNMVKDFRQGCPGEEVDTPGWYRSMFYAPNTMSEFDPTIADVHTQPTDEGGATVGRVLHVGTGCARPMVVTVNTCDGPRAYVGVVSSYYEITTENFERLDDRAWSSTIRREKLEIAHPFDVNPPWIKDLIVGSR